MNLFDTMHLRDESVADISLVYEKTRISKHQDFIKITTKSVTAKCKRWEMQIDDIRAKKLQIYPFLKAFG